MRYMKRILFTVSSSGSNSEALGEESSEVVEEGTKRQERDMDGVYIEFDSWSSSLQEAILASLEQQSDQGVNDWQQTSDPVIEDMIHGVVGNEKIFGNPFDLTEEFSHKMRERNNGHIGYIYTYIFQV